MYESNSQVSTAHLSTLDNEHAAECEYYTDLLLTSFGGCIVRVVERGGTDRPERTVFLAPADRDGTREAEMPVDVAERARLSGEELVTTEGVE